MIITTNLKLAELKNPPDLAHPARTRVRIGRGSAPGPLIWGLPGPAPPGVASGGPTFSHLNALRAAIKAS